MICFAVWLGMAAPVFSTAAEGSPYANRVLQAVVRLQAVPQSPEIAAHLQLLQALTELDLGMTAAARVRLQKIGGGPTSRELAQQYQLLLALRLRQQGYDSEAVAVLGQLPAQLPGEMERERQMLRALQLYSAGERGSAIAMMSRLRSETPLLSPIALDLALMHAQTGEVQFAIDMLQLIGNSEASNEYEEQLRDRSNLVLARLLATRGLSDAAHGALQRVRLNGKDSAAALLLLGWQRLEISGSEAALVPWLELSLRSENDPAVIEGRLAIAMALAQHQPDHIAYERFMAAIEFYRQRQAYLENMLAPLASASDGTAALAAGRTLEHGGSLRAMQLATNHEALAGLQQQWRSLHDDALHDVEVLRRELLAALQQADSDLAAAPSLTVWREAYARLQRHLHADFEGERVRTGKLPLNDIPFASENSLLIEAMADLRAAYQRELLLAMHRQQQRIAAYMEQCHYAVARLNDAALVLKAESP